MRFFYDMEFIEDGATIDLISIGIVSEDGREFYAQNADCDFGKADAWVEANVFPHVAGLHKEGDVWMYDYDLGPYQPSREDKNASEASIILREPWLWRGEIGPAVLRFVGDSTPEWWGSCSAYDHVCMCQLFGRMVDLPKGWPFLTLDVQQWAQQLGLERDWDKLVPSVGAVHNALDDARWTRLAWRCLHDVERRLKGQ